MLSEVEDQQQPLAQTKELISEKSLAHFLEMGKYFDYVVVDSHGLEHRLHKVILACHSDYFQAIFDSAFVETQTQRCVLTFPDPRHVVPQIFNYMYLNKILITPDNIIPLLHQAEYYQVTELCQMLKREIEKEYLPKHVLLILKDAVEFGMLDIVKLASSVLAENFDAVEWDEHDDYLNFLPVDVLLDVLNNRALTLDTEYRVYKVLANYTKDWEKNEKLPTALTGASPRMMTEQDCVDLYSKVFFEHLSVEQLEEAHENLHVPRSLLCEGLFIALRMALGKPVNQERLGRKYTKHMDTKRGRDFTWSGDHFDKEGVVYWLGTQLDENAFQNPHDTGHILCFSSQMQTGKASNLASRQNIPTWTTSQDHAFLGLDLGPSNFVLKPTHYSLRHGYSRDNVNLQRWRFEASGDGEVWDVLRVHDYDYSLSGCYGENTWEIHSDKWYRCFRVVTVGKYFVQICGMELYGNLLPKTLDAAFKKKKNLVESAATSPNVARKINKI